MFERFREKANSVSSEVYSVKDKGEAILTIRDIVSKELQDNGTLALWAKGKIFTEQEMKKEFANVDTAITKDKAAQALIGITEVQAAIANTGTLVEPYERARTEDGKRTSRPCK